MAGDIEFIVTSVNSIGNFLVTGIGTALLVVIGFALVGHALYRTRQAKTETGVAIPSEEDADQEPVRLQSAPLTASHRRSEYTPVANSFQEQFEKYDSFTVDEAINLLCEQTPMFSPIIGIGALDSLNPKQSVAKHLIISEYKAGHIALDHFNNPSNYSETYDKSRISKDDLLNVADKLDDPPEFMFLEDE